MRVSLDEAVRRVIAGEVIAYPTETVYGLGCDVRSGPALAALCALKGRTLERGFSVLVSDLEQLDAWAGPLPDSVRALAEAFWPGPLTLVLGGASAKFPLVATEHGVGFRCSSHPVASALAHAARLPIASTSCNPTGEVPALVAEEVEAAFGSAFPVLEGEPAGRGAPSTVVRVEAEGGLELLREGELPFDRATAMLAAHAEHHARMT